MGACTGSDGQYFRVRVRAGGTLQVTGWLGITCTPCYGGGFSVAVFTAGGTYLATIGSRGYGSNYGQTVPITSNVFTNTTGQPAEFILRLKVAVTPTPTLADFSLTFTWAEGPRLTLFLDREPTDPDFSLPTPAATFGADHTARTALYCHDYGGFTTVTVTDGPATTPDLRLPQSSSGNWLPDAGWTLFANDTPYGAVTGIANLNRDEDSDDDPTDVPLNDGAVTGDGLVAFEEYRGFVVRSEHRRTNPYRKDLFVDSTVLYDIGDAASLPLTKHWVWPAELSAPPATRRHVNVNHDNGGAGGQFGHVDQQGLVVRPSVGVVPGILGEADCPDHPNPCTPNSIEAGDIVVYENTIRAEGPSSSSEILVEPLDEPAVRNVLGHEIGHGLNMPHPDDGPPFSIMNSATVWGYDWSLIPHSYLNRDTAQIRIK